MFLSEMDTSLLDNLLKIHGFCGIHGTHATAAPADTYVEITATTPLTDAPLFQNYDFRVQKTKYKTM